MKYIASFSGGKDSAATIILAHEHKEPLDLIVFSEVMFDENTSGELPEQIDFVKNIAFPLFEKWGYKTRILHSGKSYMDTFNHIVTRGKTKGKRKGFVMSGHCDVQRDCKLKAIDDFLKQIDGDFIQYIGIAKDEQRRLERLRGTNKISLLEKYGYTEEMAFNLCRQYGLLSPNYEFSKRGGVVGFARTQEKRNCGIYGTITKTCGENFLIWKKRAMKTIQRAIFGTHWKRKVFKA